LALVIVHVRLVLIWVITLEIVAFGVDSPLVFVILGSRRVFLIEKASYLASAYCKVLLGRAA
jgi:hypothetical protein